MSQRCEWCEGEFEYVGRTPTICDGCKEYLDSDNCGRTVEYNKEQTAYLRRRLAEAGSKT